MKKRPLKRKREFSEFRRRKRVWDPATKVLMKQVGIGISLVTFFTLLISGIWYGTRLEPVTINQVGVEGGETIAHEEVRLVVEELLQGSYFGLIPKRFTVLYPEMAIWMAVADIDRVKNPRIQRVGTTLHITIDEYMPFALWCEEVGDGCYFIDDTGFAFTTAPQLVGSSLYRFVTLAQSPVKGQVMRSPEKLTNMIVFADSLDKDFSFPVLRIELDTVDDAFFILSGGGEVKISLRDVPAVLLENLRLVLETAEFSGFMPHSGQYIDLRFGNKVFVNDTLAEQVIASELPVEVVTENIEAPASESIVPAIVESAVPNEAPIATSVEPVVESEVTQVPEDVDDDEIE